MQPLQAKAFQAETVRNAALEFEEGLVREIDAASEAGDEVEVARLLEEHQRAEAALEAAEDELVSAEGEISAAATFWYEEDEDEDEDEDD
ncbi:hypothetical protein A3K89_22155 [Rhodococcoides kyotonense]|uniref:Uncharacterized protein n=2 Tax=Rhodococcoides kyotonense TaxID=398843 RepID=A0A177YE64_9NOCA|nr:hypothetical protein A3K89_22155 [Rhodococcus kyotonensis]